MDELVNVEINPKDIKPSECALALASLIFYEASCFTHEPDYKLIRSYASQLHHLIAKNWFD